MDRLEITRRPFLRALLVVVLFPFSALRSHAQSAAPEHRRCLCLDALVKDSKILRARAESARLKLGWKPERAEELLIALASGDGCEMVRDASVTDYRHGRVVEFEGWLLSETALTVMLLSPGALSDDAD